MNWPAAGQTLVAIAAEPAHGHPVTDRESVYALAQFGDRAGDLVSGGDGNQVGIGAVDDGVVGAAHSAGLDGDAT